MIKEHVRDLIERKIEHRFSMKKIKIVFRYLSYITDTRHRTALTRLRLSSHSLHIETGRHTGTDREDRICTLCRTGVEDESHFLITCPMYNDLRSKHLTDFRGTLTSSLSDLEKALALLMSENLKPLAKFIFEASEMRNILIDSQLSMKKTHLLGLQMMFKIPFSK